jgi:hypothetical protein
MEWLPQQPFLPICLSSDRALYELTARPSKNNRRDLRPVPTDEYLTVSTLPVLYCSVLTSNGVLTNTVQTVTVKCLRTLPVKIECFFLRHPPTMDAVRSAFSFLLTPPQLNRKHKKQITTHPRQTNESRN